jgi:hypothetical protein
MGLDLKNTRYQEDYINKLLKLAVQCDLTFELYKDTFIIPCMLAECNHGKI